MRVCFLTISVMTPLYYGIAERLERAGHHVSWVSPSARWSQWLVERGVAPDVILDITRFAQEWTRGQGDRTGLDQFEAASSKSVRDLILMDRLMSERNEVTALDYMAACIRHAGRFLESHQVEAVFAEASHLLAYVVAELCQQRGIANYNIDTVRFPDGRFGFFEGIYQATLVGTRDVTGDDREQAAAFHERFLETHEKPAYFYPNQRAPKLRPILVWKLLRNTRRVLQDPHDETGFPVRRMVRDQLTRAWNHARVSRWDSLLRPESMPKRPFVLYGLHKQPEIGIDVWASYLSNQEELIRCMARSIPITHDLYVKAHSNDLGGRSRRFFERLTEIPAVRIVDPFVDSHELIRSADLVLSVTGSMAFEAGLYGRRSIALAPMFFAPLMLATGVDPYSLRLTDFAGFLSRPHPGEDPEAVSPVAFLAWVNAQSFPGIVGDPLTDPRCMEPRNLDEVAQGFVEFLAPGGRGPAITRTLPGERPIS